MRTKGVSNEAIAKMTPLFELFWKQYQINSNILESFLSNSEIGMKGIEELRFVLNMLPEIGLRKAKPNLMLHLLED